MESCITGGGWITARGYGRLSEGRCVELAPGAPVLPKGREIFRQPLSRYGRFDNYTRIGCAAIALALRDAGLDESSMKRNIGIVSSSRWECLETDLEYYATTLEEDGLFTSPNLFSYTLPGIVHGECAAHFKLTGPTFSLGESGGIGMAALCAALGVLQAGKANAMLAGWIESLPAERRGEPNENERPVCGALFVVLEPRSRPDARTSERLAFGKGRIVLDDSREVSSILDLFRSEMQ
jgi:hypothetical protein